MNLLATLKGLSALASYPETEFGMGNISFFLALLRACPEGSRLTFHQSETEAFVNAFRAWSHRENPRNFEADYYAFDRRFMELAERLAAAGELPLDHHFTIVAYDNRLLCDSLDDFTIVTLAEDIKEKIRASHGTARPAVE
jgi:hypothetical protein